MPTDLPLEERPQAHLRQTGYEQGEIGRPGAGVRLQQEVGIRVVPFSALVSFRPETIMAVMASVWMVRPSVRAEAMELLQFWTATAPLSSAWVNVASVADPARRAPSRSGGHLPA